MSLLTLLGVGSAVSGGGGGGDPDFASVVLLAINDNKADGTTTFDDQSNSNHTLTANGNAQYDTAQAPTGMTSSGLFDGTGDWITTPDHADWDFGSGDFTVEFMFRLNTDTTGVPISQMDKNGAAPSSWSIVYNKAFADLRFFAYTTSLQLINRAWTPSTATWYHIAVARSGNDLHIFVDGTQLGATGALTGTINNSAFDLQIGSHTDDSFPINGWMASVRITKGVARYTANFTPPTLPLPTS